MDIIRRVDCPFCEIRVPSSQLQRHANSHFEDDQEQSRLQTDLELARSLQIGMESELGFEDPCTSISEKVNLLLNLQIPCEFHRIEGGLMVLLRDCLESEPPDFSVSLLSGYVDHFQSLQHEDVGWGCGWRNVQILTSHLLMQRHDAREVLFSGSGFVPDIPSLQRWLEIAWEKGFDKPGSEHFEKSVYGTKKWIGTTECATLLRSFGVRAMVVDFGPKEFESLHLSVPGSSIGEKRRGIEICGPMDRFVMRKNHVSQIGSSRQEKTIGNSSGSGDHDTARETKGRQILIDWVWNYFSDKKPINSGNRRVIVTEKGPLYFQHDGHSRTIVGIQVKYQRKGAPQYTLLILDPGHRTEAIEKALKAKVGWQKLIKRGLHTLKKPQYQLCYVDTGIRSREEMESLKTIDSSFFEI